MRNICLTVWKHCMEQRLYGNQVGLKVAKQVVCNQLLSCEESSDSFWHFKEGVEFNTDQKRLFVLLYGCET